MSTKKDAINICVLALCEAIFITTTLVNFAIAGLASGPMMESSQYATLPLAMIPFLSMLAAIPASYTMRYIGRRNGFILGVLCGIGSSVLCAYAILISNFKLFVIGVALIGVYQAFATFYRFAVADQADDRARGQAVALVLAGGLLAALVGPSVASYSKDLFTTVTFVGSYIVTAAINVGAIFLLGFLRLPAPPHRLSAPKRKTSLAAFFSESRIILAILSCGLGNATMMLMMTATPLAMAGCGFDTTTSGLVLSAHVAGMFAPFLFSGSLTRLFGAERMMISGLLLVALSGFIAASGITQMHFGLALVISGLGWNFMYVGGSTVLASLGDQNNRALIQGINEVFGFAVTTIGILASGLIYATFGWVQFTSIVTALNLVLFVFFALLSSNRWRLAR